MSAPALRLLGPTDDLATVPPPWYLLAASIAPIGLTIIALAITSQLAGLTGVGEACRQMVLGFFMLSLVASGACAVIACSPATPLPQRALMIAMVCIGAYTVCTPTIGMMAGVA